MNRAARRAARRLKKFGPPKPLGDSEIADFKAKAQAHYDAVFTPPYPGVKFASQSEYDAHDAMAKNIISLWTVAGDFAASVVRLK